MAGDLETWVRIPPGATLFSLSFVCLSPSLSFVSLNSFLEEVQLYPLSTRRYLAGQLGTNQT